LAKESRVDLTVETGRPVLHNFSAMERAFVTKSAVSVAMQRISLMMAVNLGESGIKLGGLLEYLEKLKNDRFSGTALMTSIRFDAAEGVRQNELASVIRSGKTFNLRFVKNISVRNQESLETLSKNAVSVLNEKIYDDLYIDMSGLEISEGSLSEWFAGFAAVVISRYPEAKIYICFPSSSRQIKDAAGSFRNVVLDPLNIDNPVVLEQTLNNIPAGLTDIVIKSDAGWLSKVVNGDTIKKLLTNTVRSKTPQDRFALGRNQGIKLAESGKINGSEVSGEIFRLMCDFAVHCYDLGPESTAISSIKTILSEQPFNRGSLLIIKQDLERSMERIKAGNTDEIEKIKGEFAGLVEVILDKKTGLSKEIEFSNEQDKTEFMLLMMIASVSLDENIKRIPAMLASGGKVKTSEMLKSLDENVQKVLVSRPLLAFGQDPEKHKVILNSLLSSGKSEGFTLEDLIYLVMLNRKFEPMAEILKNNSLPILNTATMMAINAAG
jgi:hypothetical protein